MARGIPCRCGFAVQIDYGVVDEGKDFQLKPGLVGIAVLDPFVCVLGMGQLGRR